MTAFSEKLLTLFFSNRFTLELCVAAGVYVFSLKRRKRFVFRLIISLAAIFIVSFFWNTRDIQSIYVRALRYLVIFVMVIVGIYASFDTPILAALFCACGALATQHFAYKINSFIDFFYMSIYYNKFLLLPYAVIYAVLYAAARFIFARRINNETILYSVKPQLVAVSLIIMITAITCNLVLGDYYPQMPATVFVVINVFALISCVTCLCLQFGIFKSGRLEHEIGILEHVRNMEKEQFELAKKNIDIINIKCHDLKKQLNAFGGKLDKEELEELKSTISIYDSAVKTGNNVLDIVVAETGLMCERENIKLTCMANGEKLGFMKQSDVYSLFRNAVDNAYEAVKKIEDPGKRTIGLTVKDSGGFVLIHFENYCAGELKFAGDLPLTSKDDSRFHGFGLKSIRHVVTKYNGTMAIKISENIFNLNIIIPLP